MKNYDILRYCKTETGSSGISASRLINSVETLKYVIYTVLRYSHSRIRNFDVKVPVDLSRVNRTASGNMRVSGRVRGYVNGVIDAEIKGTLNGTLNASVTSGTTIEPTKPDFYLPESKEQAAAEWAENYTEGEEV